MDVLAFNCFMLEQSLGRSVKGRDVIFQNLFRPLVLFVNDILDGDSGIDTLLGGAGDDTYIVDNSRDKVTEGSSEGTDLVQSSVSYWIKDKDVENLTLTGSSDINGTANNSANKIIGNKI